MRQLRWSTHYKANPQSLYAARKQLTASFAYEVEERQQQRQQPVFMTSMLATSSHVFHSIIPAF
jgi:hypothetical protein